MHHVINRVGMTLGLVVTALAGAYSGPVAADDKYPSRPIEFVVPWGPVAAQISSHGSRASCSNPWSGPRFR